MKKRFIELFHYNDWANEQIINALQSMQEIPDKALQIVSHILASQDVWFERIQGTHDWNISFWDTYSIAECMVLSKQSTQNWLRLFRNIKEKDFDKIITYKNSKGNKYETSLIQIITHVINHSTYHRGQINILLRQHNIEPVPTDYIFYTRI